MKKRLVIREIAAQEFRDAAAWYEAQRRGLGSKFVRQVRKAFNAIQRAPKHFPKIHPNFRRSLVKPYNYSVHFYETDNEIVVVSVFHGSRNPDDLQSRS